MRRGRRSPSTKSCSPARLIRSASSTQPLRRRTRLEFLRRRREGLLCKGVKLPRSRSQTPRQRLKLRCRCNRQFLCRVNKVPAQQRQVPLLMVKPVAPVQQGRKSKTLARETRAPAIKQEILAPEATVPGQSNRHLTQSFLRRSAKHWFGHRFDSPCGTSGWNGSPCVHESRFGRY